MSDRYSAENFVREVLHATLLFGQQLHVLFFWRLPRFHAGYALPAWGGCGSASSSDALCSWALGGWRIKKYPQRLCLGVQNRNARIKRKQTRSPLNKMMNKKLCKNCSSWWISQPVIDCVSGISTRCWERNETLLLVLNDSLYVKLSDNKKAAVTNLVQGPS